MWFDCNSDHAQLVKQSIDGDIQIKFNKNELNLYWCFSHFDVFLIIVMYFSIGKKVDIKNNN